MFETDCVNDVTVDQTTAERLTESYRKLCQSPYATGYELGAKWAISRANAIQLERLRLFYNSHEKWSHVGYFVQDEASSMVHGVYRVINGGRNPGGSHFNDFCSSSGLSGKRDAESEIVAKGFVAGACMVWNKVKGTTNLQDT